jgi:hypothetical protein
MGTQFGRVLRTGAEFPPQRLERTIWVRGEDLQAPWLRAAREVGWRAPSGPRPPRGGFDLVTGTEAHPQSFRPDLALDASAQSFRLERRFHVVKRREFFRRFEGLVKEATSGERRPGTGFLFCPHVWVVPGLVRDVEGEGEGLSGGLSGPPILGRPYAEVFPLRLRRYLAMVLNDLEIDIVYWEDAVSWADLRRVFGVAFECFDQGRFPLDARHFQGLPRVRVLIHEESPDRAAYEQAPHPVDANLPAATHARILVVLRDRGGPPADARQDASDSRRRAPLVV